LRFDVGRRSYVVYERHNDLPPPSHGTETTKRVAIFTVGYLPSNGEKAEFKRQALVEEGRCSKFPSLETWPANLENEDFIYGP
jgi:hypothetical protein